MNRLLVLQPAERATPSRGNDAPISRTATLEIRLLNLPPVVGHGNHQPVLNEPDNPMQSVPRVSFLARERITSLCLATFSVLAK